MFRLWFHTVLAVGALALVAAAVRADPDDEPDKPPLSGQPADFETAGGAIGTGFQATLKSSAESVQIGDTLTLTLSITAKEARQPPRRPRLWELKPYRDLEKKKALKIDRPDLNDKKWERPDRTPNAKTWEFDYKVRIQSFLEELPRLRFPYYSPSGVSGLPGQYQETIADELPLTVKARVEPTPEAQPIRAPDFLLSVTEGPAVLERREVFRLPSLAVLLGLVLLPPLTAFGGYRAWRRLFPDAARRARHRESRAAQSALVALRTPAPPERVAAIAVGYLQNRLGMPGSSPTPVEVAAYLERAGAAPELAGKAAEFFRACDAARFAPAPPDGADDLASAATRLITTLESESWAVSPS